MNFKNPLYTAHCKNKLQDKVFVCILPYIREPILFKLIKFSTSLPQYLSWKNMAKIHVEKYKITVDQFIACTIRCSKVLGYFKSA